VIKWMSIVLLFSVACGAQHQPKIVSTKSEIPMEIKAPRAKKEPKIQDIHDDSLVDNYFWMRDKKNPQVIAYLEAENAYTKTMMAKSEALQASIFKEMKGRIRETDETPPYRDGDYLYYQRTVEGLNYPIHCRKKNEANSPEEIILDENKMAKGHEYFEIGVLEVSPNHKILAYSTDVLGNERYTLKFRDLESGKDFEYEIKDTSYSLVWANDNKTIYYDRVDKASRPYRAFRHVLASAPADDVLVYEEKDERFFLSLEKTRSNQYIFIQLASAETSEYRMLDANASKPTVTIFAPRKQKEEYYVTHQNDAFYIVTNADAMNFKVMKSDLKHTSRKDWKEVLAQRAETQVVSIDAFKDYLVISERHKGVPRLVITTTFSDFNVVEQPEPVYDAYLVRNFVYDTDRIRFRYTSLVTPRSTIDYVVKTKERKLIKETPVKGYDRSQYQSERLLAAASDGTQIPISLVYKKDKKSGSMPLLLAGYGSYGASYDPYFSSTRISLLDRGVAFAIAHIRGGGEMGRNWYLDGKYLKKKNTFNDFISVSEFLIEKGYTDSTQLAITGRSAGGLLMGAVTNMRPDLFKAVIAGVPFVDVINTMLDATIPLTVTEWEEWGNPNDKVFYQYMKSYAPYENVEKKDYPNMLVTAGLNDPRVAYWEPAKWVAKLRDMKTDKNLLLLKTNMGAGHGGASGRYDYLKEVAFEYAFILNMILKK